MSNACLYTYCKTFRICILFEKKCLFNKIITVFIYNNYNNYQVLICRDLKIHEYMYIT